MQDYLEQSGLPYTNLLTASFYENALNYTTYMKQENGSYTFSFNTGTALLARHAVADIGRTVAGGARIPAGPSRLGAMTVQLHGSIPLLCVQCMTVSSAGNRQNLLTDALACMQPSWQTPRSTKARRCRLLRSTAASLMLRQTSVMLPG